MSETPPPNEPPPPRADLIPWEEPNAGLGAFFPTLLEFVTSPLRSFSRMSPTVDLVRPLAYFVALTLFAAIAGQVWNQVLWSWNVNAIKGVVDALGQSAMWGQIEPMLVRPGALQIALGLVITPVVWLVILFVWTAMVHGVLVLLGGAGGGFAASLRAMCYAGTSWIAAIVPIVGSLISFIWNLVLAAIGLAAAHKAPLWKTFAAILLPLVLLCCCCIGAAMLLARSFAQTLQQMH